MIKYDIKRFFLQILGVSIFSFVMMKDTLSYEYHTTYTAMKTVSAGWVNLSMSNEGMYIYARDLDERSKLRAFQMDQSTRQDFEFFSIQEEEALWNLYEEQIASNETIQRKTSQPQSIARRKTLKINWPKVIVDNKQICVPKIAFSEGRDWKDHLLCWEEGS